MAPEQEVPVHVSAGLVVTASFFIVGVFVEVTCGCLSCEINVLCA